METSLDMLEGALRPKREAGNNLKYLDDNQMTDEGQLGDAEAKFEVESAMRTVKLPAKEGSPAFSIHAQKVYILYPSMFQDPNIFGRFSIPQNVNLDPIPGTTEPPTIGQQQAQKHVQNVDKYLDSFGQTQTSFRNLDEPAMMIRGKRQLSKQATANPPKSNQKSTRKEDNKKRNVENSLKGTIVVLNQDVNEFNRKESYWISVDKQFGVNLLDHNEFRQ